VATAGKDTSKLCLTVGHVSRTAGFMLYPVKTTSYRLCISLTDVCALLIEFSHCLLRELPHDESTDLTSSVNSYFDNVRIIYDKIDKNGDEKVTEEELTEWIRYVQNRYLRVDTDRQWAEQTADDTPTLSWDSYKLRVYAFVGGWLFIALMCNSCVQYSDLLSLPKDLGDVFPESVCCSGYITLLLLLW